VDVHHLGRDRVICAYELDGLIVDPGPASSMAALDGIEIRALLLTHIHLDHAGATGVLVREKPDIKVYVHERGAPHLIDPSKLLKSAAQLYGDDMARLWGEVAPVPAENIVTLSGGERVEGDFLVEYTPGHASHHVAYLHEPTGDAYTGDVAGVRIPPSDLVIGPTPPPDIDLEAWNRSIDLVESWSPSALCLTHFGRFEDVGAHLDQVRERLSEWSALAQRLDSEPFCERIADQYRAGSDEETAQRYIQAAPPNQMYLGLERYWRKRAEREREHATEAV
jgi:glyoxylase-like metal-dependent hydrolase (beta-lactamase superfamily II)